MKFITLCFNDKGVVHPVKNYYAAWYEPKTETHHYDVAMPMLMDDFGSLFKIKKPVQLPGKT